MNFVLCVLLSETTHYYPLQSDLLNMTMYDLVFEEDQSEFYNVLLSPANTLDAMNDSDAKGLCYVAGEIFLVANAAVMTFCYGIFHLASQYCSLTCHSVSKISHFRK